MIPFALKIINFVPKPVYTGMLIVLASLFLFNTCALERARTNLATARANLDTAVSVNNKNKVSLDRIQKINDDCVAGWSADEEIHQRTLELWKTESELLKAQANEKRQTETIEIYRNPDCAELAKLDINNACPALANSLRDRTNDNN